jgi:hypothetical protein
MSDMRQLFDTARGDLPPAPFTVDQITEAGRRGMRRRRLARAVSAVGAAAAVLVVAAVGIPIRRGEPPVPADPAPRIAAFTDTITGFTVGGLRVSGTLEATPGYETAAIVRAQNVVGLLTVFRPGAFDPSAYESGTPVQVGGHDAYARVFAAMLPLDSPNVIDGRVVTGRQAELPAVAWQWASGAWATVVARQDGPPGMTAGDVRTVATRVEPATTGSAATLPYKIGFLPAGWTLAAAGRHQVTAAGDDGEISRAYLLRDPTFTGLTGRPTLSQGILITVHTGTVSGSEHHEVTIPGSDYHVEVADESNTLGASTVERIAHSLTFADPARPASWYPAGR